MTEEAPAPTGDAGEATTQVVTAEADVETGTGLGPAVLTKVSGFAVHLFNDEHFEKNRNKLKVDAHILDGFVFENLAEGGGKGGDVMAFTPDRQFIVKSINGNDQDALIRHAEAICDYMSGSSNTLLSVMLYHFRIDEGDNAGCYFVMNNCLPILPDNLKWKNTFDLKGCCDDKVLYEDGERVPEVHKRCFSINTFWYGCDCACCCCNTPERMRYYAGKKYALSVKFPVAAADKKMIDASIAADCDFLRNTIVTMDYSLILGIVTCKKGEEASLPKTSYPNQPFLALTGEDEVSAYYFGIIDFLQEWTATKKIAHCIKCTFAPKPISTVEPAAYAIQFEEYFQEKFVATEGTGSGEDGGAAVEMVTVSEEDAYKLGAQVAAQEEKDEAEAKQSDNAPLLAAESEADAFAAGQEVGSEAFPSINDE